MADPGALLPDLPGRRFWGPGPVSRGGADGFLRPGGPAGLAAVRRLLRGIGGRVRHRRSGFAIRLGPAVPGHLPAAGLDHRDSGDSPPDVAASAPVSHLGQLPRRLFPGMGRGGGLLGRSALPGVAQETYSRCPPPVDRRRGFRPGFGRQSQRFPYRSDSALLPEQLGFPGVGMGPSASLASRGIRGAAVRRGSPAAVGAPPGPAGGLAALPGVCSGLGVRATEHLPDRVPGARSDCVVFPVEAAPPRLAQYAAAALVVAALGAGSPAAISFNCARPNGDTPPAPPIFCWRTTSPSPYSTPTSTAAT